MAPHEVETMAYAGETPWHGLGTYIGEEDVDARRMLEAAGLDWRVDLRALAYSANAAPVGRPFADPRESGFYAVIRDSDGRMLGNPVTDSYSLFQNEELFATLDGIVGERARYHTAGALRDGSIVWALLKVSGDLAIRRLDGSEDVIEPYLLAYAGHGGVLRFAVRFTSVRVVCMNTLSAAMNGKTAECAIKHTAGMAERVSEAREVLGVAVSYFDKVAEVGQWLAQQRMERDGFRDFASSLLRDTEETLAQARATLEGAAKTRHENRVLELEDRFRHGRGNRGETRWDALNAVTEWIDHKRAQGRDAAERLAKRAQAVESAWFGHGARVKDRAVRLLTKGR